MYVFIELANFAKHFQLIKQLNNQQLSSSIQFYIFEYIFFLIQASIVFQQ